MDIAIGFENHYIEYIHNICITRMVDMKWKWSWWQLWLHLSRRWLVVTFGNEFGTHIYWRFWLTVWFCINRWSVRFSRIQRSGINMDVHRDYHRVAFNWSCTVLRFSRSVIDRRFDDGWLRLIQGFGLVCLVSHCSICSVVLARSCSVRMVEGSPCLKLSPVTSKSWVFSLEVPEGQ